MQDNTILRRLAYVKSLFHISKEQYRKHSDITISRSLVTLDNCVEAYFWVVLEQKIPNKVNSLHDKNFGDLVDEIEKIIKDLDKNSIRELHKSRNNIQHNGILIAESQAKRYYEIVEKMFSSSCISVFEIQWNDVSLSMLIEEKIIAEFYNKAEEFFVKKDYKSTAKYLIMSFETAKSYRQLAQFGSLITLDHSSASEIPQKFPSMEPLFTYVDKVEQEIEVLKLGLEYTQWREYRLALGNMNPKDFLYNFSQKIPLDETKIQLFKSSNEEIETWVRKNMTFVLETILNWQDSIAEASQMTTDLNTSIAELSKIFEDQNIGKNKN